jgi:hypothetical protein
MKTTAAELIPAVQKAAAAPIHHPIVTILPVVVRAVRVVPAVHQAALHHLRRAAVLLVEV